MNMLSFWFKLFWMSPWNIFDFVIVFGSIVMLISPSLEDVPVVGMLTLLRPLRIFRLFKRFPSLKRMLDNLVAALPVWAVQEHGQMRANPLVA